MTMPWRINVELARDFWMTCRWASAREPVIDPAVGKAPSPVASPGPEPCSRPGSQRPSVCRQPASRKHGRGCSRADPAVLAAVKHYLHVVAPNCGAVSVGMILYFLCRGGTDGPVLRCWHRPPHRDGLRWAVPRTERCRHDRSVHRRESRIRRLGLVGYSRHARPTAPTRCHR